MASNASHRNGRDIPGFGSWTKPVADLGLKENWPALDKCLSFSGVEEMWIKGQSALSFFDRMRGAFDCSEVEAGSSKGSKFLHMLAMETADECLMRRFLSLGLNPSVVASGTRNTPSHTCCRYAHDVGAELLALCRGDLTAVNSDGQTPAARAESHLKMSKEDDTSRRFHNILTTLRIIQMTGPPSLAQLASNRQWWAVKNLCRRKAVDSEEVRSKHRGRDAVEWALHYGENDLADEIRFLYSLPAEGNKDDEPTNSLQETILAVGERISALEQELKNLDLRATASDERVSGKELSIQKRLGEMEECLKLLGAQSLSAHEAGSGDSSALQVMDAMWKEIRNRAVTSGQEWSIVTKLGRLLEGLKRGDESN